MDQQDIDLEMSLPPEQPDVQRSWKETFARNRGKLLIGAGVLVVLVLLMVGISTTAIVLATQVGGGNGNGNGNGNGSDSGENDVDESSAFVLPDEDEPFDDHAYDSIYVDPYPLDRNKTLEKDLFETKEYQLRLDINVFTNRTDGVEKFLSVLRPLTGLPFTKETAMESVRSEIQMDGSKCGKRKFDEIRIRNYLSGWNANHSTVDIKYSTKTLKKSEAASVDILPSNKIYNTSIQKIEQDVHHCYNKYSRKTMAVQVPYMTKISTCLDITKLFPHAWDETNPTKTTAIKSTDYWWLYQHSGYLLNGAQFLSSFTVVYHDLNGAIYGNETPSHMSEWSIRVWSTKDGMGPWDRNVLIDVERIYQSLLSQIGSFQDNC